MAGQYQIPEWLIPKETPGQALSRGIQDGATIARGMADNYFRNKDQQRQDALMPLHIQQMQMAVKNQALDLEIAQARQQTMLAQKSAYADLATFNAKVASDPIGYLKPENFADLWKLGQRNPELLSDPVFTQTMGQFDKAKKMKEVEDAAKAQEAYRKSLLDTRSGNNQNTIQGRIAVANINAASRAGKNGVYSKDLEASSKDLKQQRTDLKTARSKELDKTFDPAQISRINRKYDDLSKVLDGKSNAIDAEWQRRLAFHGIEGKGANFESDTAPDEIEDPNAPEEPDSTTPGWGDHRRSEDSMPIPDAVTSGPAYDANKQRLQQWKQDAQDAAGNVDPAGILEFLND